MAGRIITDATEIGEVFDRVRTLAVVGAHPDESRPSHYVTKYLQGQGYRTIPVNPRALGEPIFGEKVYATLAEIPDRVDMVVIFRRSEDIPPVVDEVIGVAAAKGITTVWMQLGIRNDAAAEKAAAAGLDVVQDRCALVEHRRHVAIK